MPGYRQAPTETPPTLTLVRFSDPAVERFGHRPGSPYVEFVWLGILGPSTTFAWQRLARLAAVDAFHQDRHNRPVGESRPRARASPAMRWCRARSPGSSPSTPLADRVTPWRFASHYPTCLSDT